MIQIIANEDKALFPNSALIEIEVDCSALRDVGIVYYERGDDDTEWYEKNPFDGRHFDTTEHRTIIVQVVRDATHRFNVKKQKIEEEESNKPAMLVSAFQAYMALNDAGYLDEIEGMMADPSTPIKHRLAFQKAKDFKRDSPTVAIWQKHLGLTDKQVDDLFNKASMIVA